MKYLKIIFISLLVLLIICFITGYIMYSKANTEVLAMDSSAYKNISGSFVKLSDGITHYELAGPDTGKVIVLVHGFSVPYYIWDSNFSFLVHAGFRVLRYDMFGRGFSDRPEKIYEADLFRKQLADLLATLKIDSVYAIAGVSFGGAVITDFTINNPGIVKKIILIDPIYPGFPQPSNNENIVLYKMSLSPNDMVNGQLTDLKYPEKFPRWGDEYKVQMQYKGFKRALISTRFHYAPEGKVVANYKQMDSLHKPVLLIWGKEDNTVRFIFSDSLRAILHADFFPVNDAEHLPMMEKAQEVNDKIISFLSKN